ncbi:unnamed protein product [Heligmosomoides polygyrus]|uniref:DDE_Tnp_1_7 domain-containing protein n=1 Tax=Heligmosomoides polygyrus TaxID=6339 RepID=A0A183GK12_HELPZ|nr:unnamed protein product [Heligmosomoides polygyrus]
MEALVGLGGNSEPGTCDVELDDNESASEGVLLVDEEDESESEEDGDDRIFDGAGWSTVVNNLQPFVVEFSTETIEFDGDKPYDFYRIFLNDELLAGIREKTNRYGSWNHRDFTHTTPDELLKFVGLCLYMGNVRLPTLRHYWSTKKMYTNMCPSIMPRNRTAIVPFRGRLSFKQYIPNKKHKFGVKLFKVCAKGGYPYKVEVYFGKLNDKAGAVSETVVMRLMDGLLDSGRRLFCDNWYSSMSLTRKLSDRRTDFVGTFRKNRRGFPSGVTKKKLERGELTAMQSNDGITVMHWCDKRPAF